MLRRENESFHVKHEAQTLTHKSSMNMWAVSLVPGVDEEQTSQPRLPQEGSLKLGLLTLSQALLKSC